MSDSESNVSSPRRYPKPPTFAIAKAASSVSPEKKRKCQLRQLSLEGLTTSNPDNNQQSFDEEGSAHSVDGSKISGENSKNLHFTNDQSTTHLAETSSRNQVNHFQTDPSGAKPAVEGKNQISDKNSSMKEPSFTKGLQHRSSKFFKSFYQKGDQKSAGSSTTFKSSTVISESPDFATENKEGGGVKLASKFSKSFYDLTSNDRLKCWKAKLPLVKQKWSGSGGKIAGGLGFKGKKRPPLPKLPAPIPDASELQPSSTDEPSEHLPSTHPNEESSYDLAMGTYNYDMENTASNFGKFWHEGSDLTEFKPTAEDVQKQNLHRLQVSIGQRAKNLFLPSKLPFITATNTRSSSTATTERSNSFKISQQQPADITEDLCLEPSPSKFIQRRHSETDSFAAVNNKVFHCNTKNSNDNYSAKILKNKEKLKEDLKFFAQQRNHPSTT